MTICAAQIRETSRRPGVEHCDQRAAHDPVGGVQIDLPPGGSGAESGSTAPDAASHAVGLHRDDAGRVAQVRDALAPGQRNGTRQSAPGKQARRARPRTRAARRGERDQDVLGGGGGTAGVARSAAKPQADGDEHAR